MNPQRRRRDALRTERFLLVEDARRAASRVEDAELEQPLFTALEAMVSFGYGFFQNGADWDLGKLVLATTVEVAEQTTDGRPALAPCHVATVDRLRGYVGSGALFEGQAGMLTAHLLKQQVWRSVDALRAADPKLEGWADSWTDLLRSLRA